MEDSRGVLIVCCEDRSLRTLLMGAAVDSHLDFCSVSTIETSRQHLLAPTSAIFVVGVDMISEEHLAAIDQIQSESEVPVIVVIEKSHEADTARVIRAGAIACLNYKDAMQSLAFLIANVASQMLPGKSTAPKRVLLVAGNVTFRIADGCLTDGNHDLRLPPISAALLESLASRPNEVVTLEDLLLKGWGRTDCANVNALHQHIYELRGRLSEYGLESNLMSVRGRGYTLRNKPG